jgi:hypothetical protein
MKKIIVKLLAVTILVAQSAWCVEFFGASPQGTPSVLYYTWDGLKLGVLSSMSIAYLSNPNDGKGYANIVAAGALVGMGTGIILGVHDASMGRKGTGAIILRDMNLGGFIGLVAGGIVGTLDGINNNKWESVGHDTSVGYLGGVILGLGIGLYEGPIIIKNYTLAPEISPIFIADSRRTPCPGIGVTTRF